MSSAQQSKRKKSEKRRRTAQLNTRLTPAEFATVRRAAAARNQSLSAFARDVLVAATGGIR